MKKAENELFDGGHTRRRRLIMKKKPGSVSGKGILFLIVLSLFAARAYGEDNPIPWTFGSYGKIEALHITYWSGARDAFGDIDTFKKPGFPPEFQEVWYRKSGSQFRVDRYIEMGSITCTEFKGKQWEKIAQDGNTYVLKERTIQSGPKRVVIVLQNISSGAGKELCEYQRSEMTKRESKSIKDALQLLALTPYLANPEFKEMDLSMLEMEKEMNPDQYKKTLAELKKRHEIQGRKTAKWNTGHGLIRFIAKGYAYVDLEWGMGLEGYVTGGQLQGKPAVVFQHPVCIYKVLTLDTTIPDSKVFRE
jgi:hypothetical protein